MLLFVLAAETDVSTLSSSGGTEKAMELSKINGIYMEPEHLGRLNLSHLDHTFFNDGRKDYEIKIRRFCNNELSRDVKLWDDAQMWNIDPRKDNTMLRDCMKYFNYLEKDIYFQARWWYTFRSFVKRCINSRRNNAVELMKKKILSACK